jgi:hypothetical protein
MVYTTWTDVFQGLVLGAGIVIGIPMFFVLFMLPIFFEEIVELWQNRVRVKKKVLVAQAKEQEQRALAYRFALGQIRDNALVNSHLDPGYEWIVSRVNQAIEENP